MSFTATLVFWTEETGKSPQPAAACLGSRALLHNSTFSTFSAKLPPLVAVSANESSTSSFVVFAKVIFHDAETLS
jgi:hypothetical protein